MSTHHPRIGTVTNSPRCSWGAAVHALQGGGGPLKGIYLTTTWCGREIDSSASLLDVGSRVTYKRCLRGLAWLEARR